MKMLNKFVNYKSYNDSPQNLIFPLRDHILLWDQGWHLRFLIGKTQFQEQSIPGWCGQFSRGYTVKTHIFTKHFRYQSFWIDISQLFPIFDIESILMLSVHFLNWYLRQKFRTLTVLKIYEYWTYTCRY